MLIYCITNTITQKKYIGQTRLTLSKRINVHRSQMRQGVSDKIHNSMRKHGWEAFAFEELYILIENNQDWLNEAEILLIAEHDTVSSGYNIAEGGHGGAIGLRRRAANIKGSSAAEIYGNERATDIIATQRQSRVDAGVYERTVPAAERELKSQKMKQFFKDNPKHYENTVAVLKQNHASKNFLKNRKPVTDKHKQIMRESSSRPLAERIGKERAEELINKRKSQIGPEASAYKHIDNKKLIEMLLVDPYLTARCVASEFGLSLATAQKRMREILQTSNIQQLRRTLSEPENREILLGQLK